MGQIVVFYVASALCVLSRGVRCIENASKFRFDSIRCIESRFDSACIEIPMHRFGLDASKKPMHRLCPDATITSRCIFKTNLGLQNEFQIGMCRLSIPPILGHCRYQEYRYQESIAKRRFRPIPPPIPTPDRDGQIFYFNIYLFDSYQFCNHANNFSNQLSTLFSSKQLKFSFSCSLCRQMILHNPIQSTFQDVRQSEFSLRQPARECPQHEIILKNVCINKSDL